MQKLPEKITALPRKYPIPVKVDDIGLRQILELNAATVNTACLWVDKKLGAKVRMLGGRKLQAGTKNLGAWFFEILQSCERINTLREKANLRSEPPLDRFEDIINEFYAQGITACWEQLYALDGGKFEKYVGKNWPIARYNAICSLVKSDSPGGERNYPCAEAFEVCPEFASFIDEGIRLADSNTQFNNQRWVPMLRAWRSAIAEMEEHWHVHEFSREQVTVQVGRGRNVRKLTPAYKQALSRNDFL